MNATLDGNGMTSLASRVTQIFRHPLSIGFHLLLVAVANYLAFWLRFDGAIPPHARDLFMHGLPWLLLVRGLVFAPFGVYKSLWRYTGLWELQQLAGSVLVSSLAAYGVSHWWLAASAGYPQSIAATDALILIFLCGAARLSRQLCSQFLGAKGKRRVLIVGAGDAGEMIVRDMKRRHTHEPVGFVDDDRSKVGQRIHGVPVLGTRDDLPRLLAERHPHEILIAIPSANATFVQSVVGILRPFKVRITTVPNSRGIMDGIPVTQIRDLSIEDLLTRSPVDLDRGPLKRLIEGRRVMVTGAGGSIGSELCRQIAALLPARLVLYERYENNLYAIATDLADRGSSRFVHAVIGDVTDVPRLDAVMSEHRPEIIFHAAAHKHVPLMEANACEAVKNNVTGTRLLVEAAERHGVYQFVFISSDKAVNPTSVMGATKRVAELVIHTHAAGSATSFSTVRFGNVLGSNGSVVPRFLEQIRAGGPVTITHPEIRRYFMLIPEAVHLVLHAAAQKAPGMVYILEMGDQIKLVDLARNLIRLAGFVPDTDVAVKFVGLRPGEKLFEELVGPSEGVQPSPVKQVLQVKMRHLADAERLSRQISMLESLALQGDSASVLAAIAEVVPEFVTPYTRQPVTAPARVPSPSGRLANGQRSPREGSVCPACHSASLSRSRVRSLSERARRSLTANRPHRCAACGWRGWTAPVEQHDPQWNVPVASPTAPDFGSIDAAVQSQSPELRQPVSLQGSR